MKCMKHHVQSLRVCFPSLAGPVLGGVAVDAGDLVVELLLARLAADSDLWGFTFGGVDAAFFMPLLFSISISCWARLGFAS